MLSDCGSDQAGGHGKDSDSDEYMYGRMGSISELESARTASMTRADIKQAEKIKE